MSERVKKVKEDVSLTPRRRSARITQRLKNIAENTDQDSTDNEIQEINPEESKTNLPTKKVRVSKKGAKASQENQPSKLPLETIEVVELSDSESSVVEVIKPSQKIEEKSTNESDTNKPVEPQSEEQILSIDAIESATDSNSKEKTSKSRNFESPSEEQAPSLETINSAKDTNNKKETQKSGNPEKQSPADSKLSISEQDKENNKRISNHLNMMRLGNKKSGRFWKSDRDRFKSVVKSKGLKISAQKRIAQKQELLRIKEYEKSLKDDVKRIREEKKQRTEENKKKRDENAKKNEIVQVIKNPAKIKRMKKKQLRMLAKRDVTKVV